MMKKIQFAMRIVMALSCSLCHSIAIAGDSDEPIRQCRKELVDARRLLCYDQLADRNASIRSDAAVTQSASAASEFGVSHGPLAAQQTRVKSEPKEMVANLVTMTTKPHGQFVVTLDNGQVWQQLQSSSIPLRLGDQVTIKAGALGSYILVTTTGRAAKVKRLK